MFILTIANFVLIKISNLLLFQPMANNLSQLKVCRANMILIQVTAMQKNNSHTCLLKKKDLKGQSHCYKLKGLIDNWLISMICSLSFYNRSPVMEAILINLQTLNP